MKNLLFILALIPMICFGQEAEDKHQSKIDLLLSETGTKTKFIDYKLKKLGEYAIGKADARVRRVIHGDTETFFLRIESGKDGVSNAVAFVEYSDLKAVAVALESLKVEVDKDLALNPDYIENKFVTEDYFYVGYYIEKMRVTWFVRLDKYGTNKHIYFSSSEPIEECVNSAVLKIEELCK